MRALRRTIAAAIAVGALLYGLSVIGAHSATTVPRDNAVGVAQSHPSSQSWLSRGDAERLLIAVRRIADPVSGALACIGALLAVAGFARRLRARRGPGDSRRLTGAIAVRGPPTALIAFA